MNCSAEWLESHTLLSQTSKASPTQNIIRLGISIVLQSVYVVLRIDCVTLSVQSGRPKEYFGTPQCFELFGMDVMFDEYLRCWLLEFNALPGLDTLDDDQREVLLDDIISLAVDPLLPPANPPPAPNEAGSGETFENGFVDVAEASIGRRPAESPEHIVPLPSADVAMMTNPEEEEQESSSGDDDFDSVEEEEGMSDEVVLDEEGEADLMEEMQVAALGTLEDRQVGLVWAGEPPDDWVS